MRQGADDVTAQAFPWADIVFGYVDGLYANMTAMAAANPGKPCIGIAVHSSTNDGVVGDCETGDMTPWSLVDWVIMRRAAGVEPSGYFSEASRAAVQAAFSVRGVAMPPEWIAGYPGSVGYGNLYPGSVAHQDASYPNYDHSTIIDNPPGWPGIDHAPPALTGDDDMVLWHATPSGQWYLCCAGWITPISAPQAFSLAAKLAQAECTDQDITNLETLVPKHG